MLVCWAKAQAKEQVWINPRMEDASAATIYEEGCLSFPGIYAKVERQDSLYCRLARC